MTPGPMAPSRRDGAARHEFSLSLELLIDDLDRAVDLGTGKAELMRDQFDQEIDALDEWGAGSHGAGRR